MYIVFLNSAHAFQNKNYWGSWKSVKQLEFSAFLLIMHSKIFMFRIFRARVRGDAAVHALRGDHARRHRDNGGSLLKVSKYIYIVLWNQRIMLKVYLDRHIYQPCGYARWPVAVPLPLASCLLFSLIKFLKFKYVHIF